MNDNSKENDQLSFLNNEDTSEKYDSIDTADAQSISSHDAYYENDIDAETMTDAEIAPEHMVRPQKVSLDEKPEVKKVKRKRRAFLKFDYQNSVILNFLIFLGNAIGKAFRNSLTVSVFTAFENTKKVFSESFFFKALSSPSVERFSTGVKKNFRKAATTATLPSILSRFFSSLIRIKTRLYAYLLIVFGTTTLLSHFFITSRFDIFNTDIYAPITSIIVLISAIFLLLCNKTLGEAVKDSKIMSLLLFDFLGIKRPTVSEDINVSSIVVCFVGFIFGVLTLFFPAYAILAVIFTSIYTYLVVKFPETGIISLILTMPFLYNKALLYITAIITLSYLFKIFSGKRTASFEFSDMFVLLFLILMSVSEFISFGENSSPMMYSAFILVYFICILALCDGVWFERAINSMILGTVFLTAYSLFTTLFGRSLSLDIEFFANTDLCSPAKTAISSTAVLSIFVMCGIIFLLTQFFISKSKSNKFAFILLIEVALVYMFREASFSAIVALIISLLIYLALISSKTVIFIVAAAVILPILTLFNSGIYSPIGEILKNEAFRVEIWSAVTNMLSKYGFTGIGMASDAFSELYASYYVGNTATVPHTYSLWFQIAITLGIPGLILFTVIVFFILQGAFSYGRNTADKWSKNRLFCYASMCSVIAILICGIGEQIIYNPRLFLLFWLLSGIAVCARRSAKDTPSNAALWDDSDIL